MAIFQIITLVIVLSLLQSYTVKRNIVNKFTLIIFTVFCTMQLAAYFLIGKIADYKFYEHINIKDMWAIKSFFAIEALYIVLSLIFTIFLLNYFSRLIHKYIKKVSLKLFTLLLSVIILSTHNGVLNEIYNTIDLKISKNISLKEAIDDLNIDYKYIGVDDIKAEAGKNIVVLSLESFEKSFLKEPFNNLTPNIKNLGENYSYYDMIQCPGGGWTTASAYITMTGLPAFFGLKGNSIFQKTYANKLPSLSKVLRKAGYDLTYLIGNKEFSGMNDMLNTFGFKVKSEKDFKEKYERINWGIHDKDLFNEFKKELLEKKNSENPFCIFLSSISTHFPNGLYDSRMEKILPPRNSDLEFMVSAVDYYVDDVIKLLKDQKMLSNTVFYILPDHKLMGNSGVVKKFKERGLFLITNAKKTSYALDKPILQIDLPKIILEGAGVKHNANFITDFIKGDKINYLNTHKKEILNLNVTSLKTINVKNGLYLEFNRSNGVDFINDEDKKILSLPKLENPTHFYQVAFDNEKRLKSYRIIESLKVFENKPKDYFLILNTSGNRLFANLKNKFVGITKEGERKIHFSKYEISILSKKIANSNNLNIIKKININRSIKEGVFQNKNSKEEVRNIKKEKQRFIAHAGGRIDGINYTNSLEALNYNYNKGFRLFELDIIKTADGEYVAAHDWKHWQSKTKYNDTVPVVKSVFLRQKISDKYTPLDMARINKWFFKHPDAILITDKITEPKKFSNQFIDKNRLRMELFSLRTIEKAIENGVAAILSENVIKQIKGDKVKYMVENNIKFMAISRRNIQTHSTLIDSLKKNNIMTYVYHVNFDKEKDEEFVLNNELGKVYGMYADEWIFDQIKSN